MIIGDEVFLLGHNKLSQSLKKFARETVKNPDNIQALNDKIKLMADPVDSIEIEADEASKKQLKKFGDFASRLYVYRKRDDTSKVTLLIAFNKAAIEKAKGSHKAYESAVLHEIGHVRVQLDWYLQQIAKGIHFIDAMPSHEFEAWIYAQTVQCLIKSLRSQVTRLLRDEDKEWVVA